MEGELAMRPKGDGSVYQLADGRWVAQIEDGYTASGSRRYRRRTKATETAARQAVRDMLRDANRGAASLDPRMTGKRWSDEWLLMQQNRLRPDALSRHVPGPGGHLSGREPDHLGVIVAFYARVRAAVYLLWCRRPVVIGPTPPLGFQDRVNHAFHCVALSRVETLRPRREFPHPVVRFHRQRFSNYPFRNAKDHSQIARHARIAAPSLLPIAEAPQSLIADATVAEFGERI